LSNRHRSRRSPRPASPRIQKADAEPELSDGAVVVGRVIRNHGFDGTLRIQSYSDNPDRFQAGSALSVAGTTHSVSECRLLPGRYALLRLDGLDSADAVRPLVGQWLVAPVDSVPALPPGEYYHYQLVGLSVITDQGELLGAIQEVLVTGSNDVYVVTSEAGEEILLPAVSQVIVQVDIEAGQMLVHLIDGLR
jgi:16S rRNA processing protein RimM